MHSKVPEGTRGHSNAFEGHSKVTRRSPKASEGIRGYSKVTRMHSKVPEGHLRSLECTRRSPEVTRRHPKAPEGTLVTTQPLENLSSRRYPAHHEVPRLTRSSVHREVPPGARGRLALPRIPGFDGIPHHPPVAPAIRLGPIRR